MHLCLLVGLLLLLDGCSIFRELGVGGDDPQWQERIYSEISQVDLVTMMAVVVERQYQLQQQDPHDGTLKTRWTYGGYNRRSHQQLRERVHAKVERQEDETLLLRLRVQREINEDLGRHSDPEEGKWRPFDDDVLQANVLLTHLNSLIRE